MIGIMQVSVRLDALPIPEYLDFHSGYCTPGSRIAGIYSRIYSYSRIFPNERALIEITSMTSTLGLSNPSLFSHSAYTLGRVRCYDNSISM